MLLFYMLHGFFYSIVGTQEEEVKQSKSTMTKKEIFYLMLWGYYDIRNIY